MIASMMKIYPVSRGGVLQNLKVYRFLLLHVVGRTKNPGISVTFFKFYLFVFPVNNTNSAMSKQEIINTLYEMLIKAQNKDPDRLNPMRDELLHLVWGKVEGYSYSAVQPRCINVLEKALTSDESLLNLTRNAFFPF